MVIVPKPQETYMKKYEGKMKKYVENMKKTPSTEREGGGIFP